MIDLLVEVAGWIGAVMILGAYLLLSAGKVGAHSLIYHWMNVVGAVGFVINASWHGAIPSAAVNVIWVVIGGFALWRITRRSGESGSEPVGNDRIS
jgi:hypothetical protein